MASKFITLNTGAKMPIFGLGTWQSKPGEVRLAVEAAVNAGYRLIDGAWAYQNEDEIGQALKNLFAAGTIKRDDIFITTKLHGYFHKKEQVEEGIRDSLSKLGLDYVDMYLIHAPWALQRLPEDPNAKFPMRDGKLMTEVVDHLETWKGMEEVCKKGLTKAIGMSNFNEKQIQRVWDNAAVKPANVQVECHAYWPQFELQDFCKNLGIALTAYSPIGSPGRPGRNPGDETAVPMEDPLVLKLAEKYKKTPAQILLKYTVQRGIVVIPKSTNPQRIQENFQVWDFTLDDQEFKAMTGLKKRRLIRLTVAQDSPDYPWHGEKF